MNKNQSRSGFTLIEALFFVMLVSSIFIALVFASSFSIRNNRTSEQKLIGTHYAEELREWLRGEKESDWPTFFSKSSTAGLPYCFNSTLSNWPASASCNNVYGLNGTYLRQATLTRTTDAAGNNRVRVDITVSFKDGPNVVSARDNTLFVPWE